MPGLPMIAITREVGPSLADCELSYIGRAPIDVALASAQHDAYCAALAALGCRVIRLDAEAGFPDSVFVEDVAMVVDEVALMTRPGAPSRRGEGQRIAEVLSSLRPLLDIEAPGTLDGGDILRIGRDIYVGRSARSNAAGIAQLGALLAPYGYTVHPVAIRDCLHLKSAVTLAADGVVLMQPAWVEREPFARFDIIEVDPAEEHAANVLRVGRSVLMPACFPGTRARLESAGLAVVAVDVSELQKAEGAVTCCSIVFDASQAPTRR